MAAQAERLKISITEENRAIKALQEAAYIKGYMTAELRGAGKEKESERTQEKKKVFPYPKTLWRGNAYSYGGFSKVIRGDITAAFILVPMGIMLITSKEMLIVNKYFWECEGKEWYL